MIKFSKDMLLDEIVKGYIPEYIFFWGRQKSKAGVLTKSCLSQWWESPFRLEDHLYQTAEHYMMAQKAILFLDKKAFQRILGTPDPKQAQQIGRSVRGFDESIWCQKEQK